MADPGATDPARERLGEICYGPMQHVALLAVLDELDRTEREWSRHARAAPLRHQIRRIIATALGVTSDG